MVRLRHRGTGTDGEATDEAAWPALLADFDGAEAFAPRPDGDPDDPFSRAFAEERWRRWITVGDGGVAGAGLVLAVVLLVAGVLAVALGIPDDGSADVESPAALVED